VTSTPGPKCIPLTAILAGHSHVNALCHHCPGRRDPSQDFEVLPAGFNGAIFGLYGDYSDPRYWDALCEAAPGHAIILQWAGNEHNSLFLIEQSPTFDFVLSADPSFAIDPAAVLIPETLIRARLEQVNDPAYLVGLLARLRSRTGGRLFVAGSPPPKGDDEQLRGLLFAEPIFRQLAEKDGTSRDQIRLTSPLVRLKLWHVLQNLYREQAERSGAEFIPVPEAVKDPQGFLRRDLWHDDATHANPTYGAIMLAYLEEQIARARAPLR
jgi:hypothetical protein